MPRARTSESDPIHGRNYAYIASGLAFLIALLPYLYGKLLEPVGQSYLGYQYNTDDHMVYSAWMRQAAEGRFFFDNRFAVDAQPGLTVHLYFFVLGLFSKLAGLALAANLAKAGFAALFVWLLYRLLNRVSSNVFFVKLGLSIAVIGGGVGFLVWQRFGEMATAAEGNPLANLIGGRLPTDVWQPEAFVFPSLLTNGLFMASLCLIVGIFLCVLDARDSWRPVPFGFVWFGLLMNVHSYDVLLVALVLIGFLAATIKSRTLSGIWLGRVGLMALGAVGPALWFLHVYRNDSVFQARAATDTFSPNFRAVLFGLLVMASMGLYALARGDEDEPKRRSRVGAAIAGVALLILFLAAGRPYDGFWMDGMAWGVTFAAAVGFSALFSGANPAWNLVVSWALVGLAAIYFPALFQRKLSMGLSVPWAILASMGLWQATRALDRGMRNLVAVLAILVLGASSVRWFLREGEYIRQDVSRTTVHPVNLTNDVVRILAYLDQVPNRKVALAMPGIAKPTTAEDGSVVLDHFESPYIPDLNPILSGLTGCYTYAGHWSETPHYLERRNRATAFFIDRMAPAQRQELIKEIGATHIVAPVPEAFDNFFNLTQARLADLTGLGITVVEGTQFRLIEIRR